MLNINEVIGRGNNSILNLEIIEEKIQSMNGIMESNIKENEKRYSVLIPVKNISDTMVQKRRKWCENYENSNYYCR